jgi:gliding motility-associated-like protein
VFSGIAAGTAYSWSVVDGNLCEDSGTLDVTQPETLVLTITTQTNVSCFGGNDGEATASATGGTTPYSYSWSDGQTTATATGLAAGTYDVMVTDNNGCFDETTVTITEPDQIIVDAGADAEICETETYTLQGSASNYDYVEWSGGNGTFSNVNDLYAVYTPADGETGSIILTLTAYGIGDCEDAQDQMTLNINPAPSVDAGTDAEICETNAYVLQGSASNYSYVEWSGGNGSFSNVNDLNAVYTPGDNESGAIVLTLTAYGSGACSDEFAEDSMTLTITPAPLADAGPDAETCEMTMFHVTEASAENYSSIQWTHNGLGNMSGANGLTPIYMPAVGETGTITLILTVNGNGSCEEASDEMTLTITAEAIVDAGSDAETCEMMSFTVTDASAQNYSTVLWTHNGTGSLSDANTLTPTYTPGNAEIGQVILTLTANGTGSCGDVDDSMVLNITPKPVADAGADAEVCQNSTITLQGIASNYSYVEWTGGNGTFSDINDLNASYIPDEGETGAITLTLTAFGNGSCGDVSDDMTLTITPTPLVYAGPDAEVCEDGAIELQGTASNYNSVLWTGGNGTFSNANSLNAIYTPGANETGNIVLTLTAYGNGSCEEVSDEMTLIITALPVVDAGPAGQSCEETNYEITGASASNYTTIHWTTDGAGILYNASTINPIYAPAEGELGLIVFTLTAIGNGSCGEVSDETTLNILGAPTAYAGPDEQTCQNIAFTVTGASAENYNAVSWSHNGAGSLTDANTLNPTYMPATDELGEVILTLNVQGNAYCGDATDEMTLTIISGAYAFAGEDATVCEAELYELTDATADNYTSVFWTTSGDGEFSNNTILNPVYAAGSGDLLAGNATLTLTVNGVGSCGDVSDEMTITYNPLPEVFAGEDANTCANDAYTIADATANNYGSLLWTTNGDGTFNNNNLLNPIYTPGNADISAGSVVLFITAYSETSCPDVTDEMTLSITLQPDVFAGEDALTCGTDGYELIDATADMYESLLWITSGDGTFNDATILNPVYTPGAADLSEGSVILTLTAMGSGSCGDASDEMILEFVPEPTVYAGEDAETCASDASIEIGSSSATNYVSLTWTTNGDGSFDNNTILNPVYVAGANDIASGQVTLTITAIAAGNCNDATDEMVVIINANPVANAGVDQTIQIGTSTTLAGSATGGSGLYAYYWTPEELLVDPNEQNPTTVNLNTNPTVFILQVTDGMTGCYDYDTVLINLENIPEDVVVAVDDYDTTDFNTTTVIDILLNDSYPSEGIPSISICDEPANGMVVINSDGTITYTPNLDFTGEDVFCYKICDAELTNLCDSAMVYVQVQEGATPPDDLIIFNALTPNGDGMNDSWIIQGIENYPDNKVYLFNRWGDEIHYLEGYDNTRIYWDGKNKKDRMLPDGTYYYVFYIKIEGVEKVFTGWVFMHGANQQ